MSDFYFVPLGVGDAFSTRYYSSCLLLEHGQHRLLIDCPHPIRKILFEATGAAARTDIDDLTGLVLTHLHADHCSGVEGFGFYSHFVLGKRIPLIGHRAVLDDLWPSQLELAMALTTPTGKMDCLDDYFEVNHLTLDQPLQLGSFSLECRQTIHPIFTTALRVSCNQRTLGYSSDTSFDPDLIDWLSDCDCIIHETNYGMHTPYEKLAGLPDRLRDKMCLIHYPDDFDLDGSAIEPLVQGNRYKV